MLHLLLTFIIGYKLLYNNIFINHNFYIIFKITDWTLGIVQYYTVRLNVMSTLALCRDPTRPPIIWMGKTCFGRYVVIWVDE